MSDPVYGSWNKLSVLLYGAVSFILIAESIDSLDSADYWLITEIIKLIIIYIMMAV